MNITFGAKLLTKPEQFFLKRDNLEDRKKISGFFKIMDSLIDNGVINKAASNDTVEFERINSKKGFNFRIKYLSPDISSDAGFQNIKMSYEKLSEQTIFDSFRQIMQAIFYKKGFYNKDKSIFITFEEMFKAAFGCSMRNFFNTLVIKK